MNVKQKLVLARVLKVIFYLMGFPLLVLLVAKDSMPFMNEDHFAGSAATGIWIAVILWLAVTLVQFGLKLLGTKQTLRTVITVVLAVVLMLLPMQIFDSVNSKKIEELQAQAEKDGTTVKDYKKQSQWFVTLSDKGSYTEAYNSDVDKFIETYGLNGYMSDNYRLATQVGTAACNEDGTINYAIDEKAMTTARDKAYKDGESFIIYNPNGLIYDGYIYGVREALSLLIEYHEFQNSIVYEENAEGEYIKQGDEYVKIDKAGGEVGTHERLGAAQDILAEAMENAESSAAWLEYSSTEEFIANETYAATQWLNEERLGKVLDLLFTKLVGDETLSLVFNMEGLDIDTTVNDLINALLGGQISIDLLPDSLSELLGPDLAQAIVDIVVLIKAYAADTDTLTIDELATDLVNILYPLITTRAQEIYDSWDPASIPTEDELNAYVSVVNFRDTVIDLFDTLGIKLLDDDGNFVMTQEQMTAALKNGLMDLLGHLSFYQHPANKVSWQFINTLDEYKNLNIDLQRYAWVKYACEEYGAFQGCLLVANDAPLVGGTIGNGTSADNAYNLTALKQLKTDIDYKSAMYPVFAARRYFNSCVGVVALSIYFTAMFAKKEKDCLAELIAGGIQ